jgi:hypothetical protein
VPHATAAKDATTDLKPYDFRTLLHGHNALVVFHLKSQIEAKPPDPPIQGSIFWILEF